MELRSSSSPPSSSSSTFPPTYFYLNSFTLVFLCCIISNPRLRLVLSNSEPSPVLCIPRFSADLLRPFPLKSKPYSTRTPSYTYKPKTLSQITIMPRLAYIWSSLRPPHHHHHPPPLSHLPSFTLTHLLFFSFVVLSQILV